MSTKRTMKITAVSMEPSPAAAAAEGPAKAQASLKLAVAIENPADQPLHVWASWRAYDYDPASRVLTVYLTEHTPPTPPGITMISDHPRTPAQVMVPAKGRATISVTVPATIRRRVPGPGLGMNFVEEQIGAVDRVEMHIQSANQPLEPAQPGESPDRHRERLRQTGDVVSTTVNLTERKEK